MDLRIGVIVQAWEQYPLAFDLLLYFLFFGAVARAALANRFPGRAGRVLSVAVGLVLAVSLAAGQNSLGFSIERLGPVAILLICLVVLIIGYKFMASSGVPKPLVLVAFGALLVVLARITMPEATAEIAKKHPGIAVISVIALLVLLFVTSKSYVRRLERRTPAHLLTRHKFIPGERPLRQEKRIVKRRLRRRTKKVAKQEKEVGTELHRARTLLD